MSQPRAVLVPEIQKTGWIAVSAAAVVEAGYEDDGTILLVDPSGQQATGFRTGRDPQRYMSWYAVDSEISA